MRRRMEVSEAAADAWRRMAQRTEDQRNTLGLGEGVPTIAQIELDKRHRDLAAAREGFKELDNLGLSVIHRQIFLDVPACVKDKLVGTRSIKIEQRFHMLPVLCQVEPHDQTKFVSDVPAKTTVIGRVIQDAALAAGLPKYRIDNHGFRRGFAVQAEDTFGRQRTQRLLVHGDGSHVTAEHYLGSDLSMYDTGAMWTGEGDRIHTIDQLASVRLTIPELPVLTKGGLDEILDEIYVYLKASLTGDSCPDIDRTKRLMKNRRRQVKHSTEREIHRPIFLDLLACVKEWASLMTPGSLEKITATPVSIGRMISPKQM
ncbi:hypothetical protein HKX48_003534, partial [Thoreauomyces humboldtii]